MTAQHTKAKLGYDNRVTHGWAIYEVGSEADGGSDPDNNGGIVGTSEWIWLTESNAKKLVHCWNCHDDLLEALQRFLIGFEAHGLDWQRQAFCGIEASARAAIARARGQE